MINREPIPLSECVSHDETCAGEPQYFRPNGDPGGPLRCKTHREKRMRQYESGTEKYANSATPPPGFDPTYAGERWNEDD